MHRDWRNGASRRLQAVRAWPLLQHPRWLVALVAMVVTADLAAIVAAALKSPLRPADLMLFGALTACMVVTVEFTRRSGEQALVVQDVFGVWGLPMAILLPPVYALLAPLPRLALMQWRIRRIAPHRRVFSAAALSLSYGATYLTFHLIIGAVGGSPSGPGADSSRWVLAVGAAFAVNWLVSHCLILAAAKGSDRSVSVRGALLEREGLRNELTEICVATVVTLGIAITPVVLVFALPFVTLLQRSSRHAQLVNDSRIDAKTGLLNAVTWRRESSAEVSRAQRTGAPLAAALIDIDHFKNVNDTYGHLAGDEALCALSDVLRQAVRDYDLVGRFGGEEFSLLMPQTTAGDAQRVAERIRERIAALRIDAGSRPGIPITLTVSIGVAVAGGGDITELLAAADSALYRAKRAGRNQVMVVTGTAPALAAGLV
ncbi:MAG: diguanylate cyclase [Streptosporangiaceae bacterium]